MPDVSAKIKGLNVEFNDNLTTSPNIDSGDDIKTSFARIHKRFSQMKSAAYIDASISDNKTITLGDSSIGVVSISQNQGLTDIEKTNARTNIGAGTSNFNGSFNSLTDKPTTIAGYGITDAFSGSFTNLTNKPTTISGYGITDAKIQNGTITLGSNTIKPITSFSSLDSPLVGGSGKYISSISETDGIISATETTLDTVPTENSTNAITSGAVYTDSANQQLEIDYAINTGVKNLLQFNGYGTGAENGVTYVINSDGTITVNGTPQGSSQSYIELKLNGNAANIARFCDGHHILSGCPEGGSDSTYRMYAARSSYSRFDYGDGVLLTDTTLTDVRLVVYISNGYTANNLVFKPMIRQAEIKDGTFQPYAPTNRELYEMILALQNGRSLQSVNSPMTLNLSRNDLNESLDTNFESLDSIPEEESESYNIDEELTEEEESE